MGWGDRELAEPRPALHAFRALLRAMPDWDEVAVVTHWGFIRGFTGAELHNTESIRIAPDAAADN